MACRHLHSLIALFLVTVGNMSTAVAGVSCTVAGTTAAFGVYNPLNATPLNSTGTVTVTCSLTSPDNIVVPFNVALSRGGSGSYTARALQSGAASLGYNLYVDSAYAQIWGDGTSGTSMLAGSIELGHGIGRKGTDSVVYTTFARIPSAQDVAPGTYNDLITVSVTW
jgi:spore coat protein U-like protein